MVEKDKVKDLAIREDAVLAPIRSAFLLLAVNLSKYIEPLHSAKIAGDEKEIDKIYLELTRTTARHNIPTAHHLLETASLYLASTAATIHEACREALGSDEICIGKTIDMIALALARAMKYYMDAVAGKIGIKTIDVGK